LLESEKTEQNPRKTELKAEQDSEWPFTTRNCTTSYTSFGFRKSRRNLTEVLKLSNVVSLECRSITAFLIETFLFRLKRKNGEYAGY
jgi:hypothetical protein